MSDVKNVLVGTATMSISTNGTTWTEVGYTDDGVTVDAESSYLDVTVDEELSPIKKKRTAIKILVTANLAESTLENYQLAMGLPATSLVSASTTKTLTIDPPADIPEYQVKLVGTSPDDLARTFTLTKVVSVGKVSSKYTNKGKTLVPVQFEALKGETGYGTIVDTLPSA